MKLISDRCATPEELVLKEGLSGGGGGWQEEGDEEHEGPSWQDFLSAPGDDIAALLSKSLEVQVYTGRQLEALVDGQRKSNALLEELVRQNTQQGAGNMRGKGKGGPLIIANNKIILRKTVRGLIKDLLYPISMAAANELDIVLVKSVRGAKDLEDFMAKVADHGEAKAEVRR
ncbi:hypothetical protein ABPG75_004517 [Micractinium tetrahymenae]